MTMLREKRDRRLRPRTVPESFWLILIGLIVFWLGVGAGWFACLLSGPTCL